VSSFTCVQQCTLHNSFVYFSFVTGPKPKVSEDAFEDLLGGHTFSAAQKKEPRTIKEMRREIDAKDLDPDQLKVRTISEIQFQ